MKKIFYLQVFVFFLCFFFVSCANTNYIEKNYSKNILLLKNSKPYISSTEHTINKQYLVDQERASQIREYFKENTELDLDIIAASQKSTWEKAVEIAVFVAKNIPHDNQKEWLDERNAITLWEYSKRVQTGFNCRWHATLLSELLLSIGIRNSFVTCLPYDKEDGDCHVVNIVWLPELNKWAMLDCDMLEFITDSDGTPLSLQEMREFIQKDKTFTINVLPGFEKSWVGNKSGKKYLQAYWAKNLYWFALFTVYSFDLEGIHNSDGTTPYQKYYTCLIPPDYDCSDSFTSESITSDDQAFWSY